MAVQEVKYESVATGEQRVFELLPVCHSEFGYRLQVVGQMLNATVSGRPLFASVDVDLQGDQAVVARTGSLLTMDSAHAQLMMFADRVVRAATLKMVTGIHGGCWQGLQRHCSGLRLRSLGWRA